MFQHPRKIGVSGNEKGRQTMTASSVYSCSLDDVTESSSSASCDAVVVFARRRPRRSNISPKKGLKRHQIVLFCFYFVPLSNRITRNGRRRGTDQSRLENA